jgi:CubicO group peptidase (beta-lactamase class C family)
MKAIPLIIVFLFLVSIVVAEEEFPFSKTFQPYIDNNEIAGIVVMVTDKDKILQSDYLGFRNIEKQEPMTDDSVFWMASQTKPVTGVAAMILVERGKLSLTEPVTTYVPELAEMRVLKEKDDNHTLLVVPETPITMEKLLSHTAGMQSDSPNHRRHGLDTLPLRHTITAAMLTPLECQPGTKFTYSNFSMDLAAAVIERIAHEPFEVFLQKNIFDKLGMKDTTFFPNEEQQSRAALVHTLNAETKKLQPHKLGLTYPLEDRTRRFAEAGGGLFSTPNDFVKFYQMLLGEGTRNGIQILKPESVKIMTEKHTGDLPQSYGLGIHTNNGIYSHGGAAGTRSIINTNKGLAFLYFSQCARLPKESEANEKFVRIAEKK